MGCISSKAIMTRSNSLKEEMNQSFQRMAKGFTVLEDLCLPKNGGDPVLSLVCGAHNVAGKLHIRDLTLHSDTDMRPPLGAMSPEIINTWDLMAGLEEEEDDDDDDEGKQQQQQSPPRVETAASVGKGYKSFHWSPECALHTKPNFNGTEVITRSRSFHTVQEFDEMLDRNWMPKAVLEADKSQDLVTNIEVQYLDTNGSRFKEYEDANGNSVAVYGKEESHFLGEQEINSGKELNVIEEKEIMEVSKPGHQQNKEAAMEMLLNSTSSNYTIKTVDIVEDITATKGNAVTERTGLRRKVMADGLTTLKIPTENIDFPAASRSLKEWLDVGGQLFSPGTYVTPKFGPLPSNSVNENQCNEDSIFDQEIVTAFEEAMQQLQAEEEYILRQIIKNFEECSSKEKEVDI